MKNPEKKETASDLELALLLIKHMDNPCSDPYGNKIKDFYVREAEKTLGTIQNPEVKKLLEAAIKRNSV